MVAEALEDTAHDAVAARMNLNTGLVTVGLGSIRDCIGMDGSVLKLDTVGNSLHIILRDILVGPHMVNLLLHIFRMCKFRGEITVIGKGGAHR